VKLESPTTVAAPAAATRPAPSPWRAVAIAVLALAALSFVVAKFLSSGPVTPEAASPPLEIRQVTIEGLTPVGRIPRSEVGKTVPIRFRWQKVDSASYYFVRVFGPGGTPIDSGQSTSASYEVREGKRGLFLSPGEFTWEVTAYTADAKSLGRSERAAFTIEER